MSFGQEMRDFANSFNSGIDSYARLENARALRSRYGGGGKPGVFDPDAYFKSLTDGDSDGSSGDDASVSPTSLKPKAAPAAATTALAPASSVAPNAAASAPYVPPPVDSGAPQGIYYRGGSVEHPPMRRPPYQEIPTYADGGPVVPGARRVQGMNQRPLPSGMMANLPPRPRMALPVTQMGNGMMVRPAGNIVRGYDNGGAVNNLSYAFDDGGPADYPPSQDPTGYPDDQSDATAAPTPTAPAQPAIPPTPSSTPTPGTAHPDGAGLLPMTDENGIDDNGRSGLQRALDGGIKWLSTQLGLNQAVPGGGQQSNPRGQAALMAGYGAADPATAHAAMSAVDPQNKLPTALRVIKTMQAGYDYYLMHGNLNAANSFAASMIQYTQGVAEQYGRDALDYLQNGHQEAAVQSLIKGAEIVPNGSHPTDAKMNKDGTVTVTETDTATGRPLNQHTLSPEDLYAAATGLANKSLGWQRMIQAAGNVKGAQVPTSPEETAIQNQITDFMRPHQPGQPPAQGGAAPAQGAPAAPGAPPQGALPTEVSPSDQGGPDVGQGPTAPTTPTPPAGGPTVGPRVVPAPRGAAPEGPPVDYGNTGEAFGGLPASTPAAVVNAARGIPGEYRALANKLMAGESSYNPNAIVDKNNPRSAAGLFQFTPDTWKTTTGQAIDPKVLGTKDDPRFNPQLATQAFIKLVQNNARDLQNGVAGHAGLGYPPTQSDLALAHQQGAAGALALLEAKPGETAVEAGVPASHLTANGMKADILASDAVDHIKKYYGAPDTAISPDLKGGAARPTAVAAATPPQPWTQPIANPNPVEKTLGVKGVLPQDAADAPVQPQQPQWLTLNPQWLAALPPQKARLYQAYADKVNADNQKSYGDQMKQYQLDFKNWKANGANGPLKTTVKASTDNENAINEAMGASDGGAPGGKNTMVNRIWGQDADKNNNFDKLSKDGQDGVRDVAGDLMARNGFNAREALQWTHNLTAIDSPNQKQGFQINAMPGGNAYRVTASNGQSAILSKGQLGTVMMMRHEGLTREGKIAADTAARTAARAREWKQAGDAAMGTARLAGEGVQAIGTGAAQGARALYNYAAPRVGAAIAAGAPWAARASAGIPQALPLNGP